MKAFYQYIQLDSRDYGPACLRMLAKYYGKNSSLQGLCEKSYITREGVSLLGISDAAEKLGFQNLDFKEPKEKTPEYLCGSLMF